MEIRSPMAGTVVKVNAKEEENVHKKDTIIVVESMKLEISVDSPSNGKVTKMLVSEGDFVEEDQIVAELE